MATINPHNFTWEQGEDMNIVINYLIRTDEGDVPLEDFETYNARMDIATTNGVAVFSLNSEDFDGELDVVGEEDNEMTLTPEGAINIQIGREVTLPGNPLGTELASAESVKFKYDLFIRPGSGRGQKKILRGEITLNRSITRWT